MGGDEDDGRTAAYGGEPSREFDAGHATQLNVEHQAAELGMLGISEK